MRADYFCFPLFCCLETGGQIIEHREYMFISPFLPLSSPPPLPGDPIFRGIKRATQPHFSNLLQSLIRGVEELWHEAHVQPAGPRLRSLPSHSCPAGTVWPLLVPLSLLEIPLNKSESCVNSFSLHRCAKGCRCRPL